MHVHARKNVSLKIVLDLGKPSREIPHVMVVDEGNRPDSLLVLVPLLPDQVIADQVAECFRPVGILAPLDVMIESVQQMMIKRYAKPNELSHDTPVLRFEQS
jgi:hypothetical protein